MSYATIDDYKYYYPDDDNADAAIQQELDFAGIFLNSITDAAIAEKPRSDLLNKLCVKICFYELNPESKKDGAIVSESLEGYSYKISQPKTSYYGVNDVDTLIEAYLSSRSGKWSVRGGVL